MAGPTDDLKRRRDALWQNRSVRIRTEALPAVLHLRQVVEDRPSAAILQHGIAAGADARVHNAGGPTRAHPALGAGTARAADSRGDALRLAAARLAVAAKF